MLRTAALRGAAAGLAGVAVMTAAEKVEQRLTRRPNSYVPGRTLLALVAERPPEWTQPTVWNHAVHWGTGALLGGLRGLIRRRRSAGPTRWRFDGEIAAFGTTSGYRVVVGRWPVSPFGSVSDVMIEAPDGIRLLIAPSVKAAQFVASTYRFDSVEVGPVEVFRQPGRLEVAAGQLRATMTVGRRGWLGMLLRAVPRPVATAPAWVALLDPLVRAMLPGVRTRGSAGAGRKEWYGAWDHHRLRSVTASWGETDLGAMTDVFPAVRFGFGSAPRQPCVVRLTTTVQL